MWRSGHPRLPDKHALRTTFTLLDAWLKSPDDKLRHRTRTSKRAGRRGATRKRMQRASRHPYTRRGAAAAASAAAPRARDDRLTSCVLCGWLWPVGVRPPRPTRPPIHSPHLHRSILSARFHGTFIAPDFFYIFHSFRFQPAPHQPAHRTRPNHHAVQRLDAYTRGCARLLRHRPKDGSDRGAAWAQPCALRRQW